MKLLRTNFIIIILISFASVSYSQNEAPQNFSLKEAQEYALQNSYKSKNSALDVEFARKQVKQYTSVGLPQVSANGKFNYYVDIPTSLMPDFISPAIGGVLAQYGLISPSQIPPASDQKIPVSFGSKYNLSGDVTLSQLIFDGTYIIGLKTAKVYVEMTRTSQVKSQQEVKESITQAYYLVLVARENRNILDSSILNLKHTLFQTKEILKNGFIDSTDVDQINLLVSNLENKLAMVDRQIEMVGDLLKFQMGIEINKEIVLTDQLDNLLLQAIAATLINKDFDPKNHIDYKLLATSNYISQLQYKMDKFKYLPTLVGFGTLSYSAQRDKFNFFKSGSEYPWYRTTILGLSLSIPIWSSGSRGYKIQMDRFTLKKNDILLKQVEQGLSLEVQNAKSNLRTFTDQYQNEINNLSLSRRIYAKTLIKYNQGISTSMELTQAHNQYLTTQGNYFNTILELLNAHSKLNKAMNNY